MRKPRPQDFSPEYKKVNSPEPEKVDLSDAVAIKPKPTLVEKQTNLPVRSENRTDARTEDRSDTRSRNFPVKRITKRYSFEFYEDQISKLKQIKYKVEMEGNRIAMSEIVREALDDYFENRNTRSFENPIARNSERTDSRPQLRSEKRPI